MRGNMREDFVRFDLSESPIRTKWYLMPLIALLSYPANIRHRTRLQKIGMESVKPPYLLLCNHNAFMDFKVASRAMFPHRANYVVAIDGFIGRERFRRN